MSSIELRPRKALLNLETLRSPEYRKLDRNQYIQFYLQSQKQYASSFAEEGRKSSHHWRSILNGTDEALLSTNNLENLVLPRGGFSSPDLKPRVAEVKKLILNNVHCPVELKSPSAAAPVDSAQEKGMKKVFQNDRPIQATRINPTKEIATESRGSGRKRHMIIEDNPSTRKKRNRNVDSDVEYDARMVFVLISSKPDLTFVQDLQNGVSESGIERR